MELKYRGVAYSTFPTSVKIEGKKNEVCFRGCRYTLKEAVVNLPQANKSEMVYRGVKDKEMQERRFLGNKYVVHSISLMPSC